MRGNVRHLNSDFVVRIWAWNRFGSRFRALFSAPLALAIASVAVIHLLNNIFKAILVGKFANASVVLKFGIPAAIAALGGAFVLEYLTRLPTLFTARLFGFSLHMTIVGLIVGILVIASSLFTLIPEWVNLAIPPRYIPLGGLLSGFFGGLSGYQGRLRAAFLINAGLETETYIGTSALSSIIVDTARLLVYGWVVFPSQFTNLRGIAPMLGAAVLTALLGSYIGSKWMHKLTYKTLQILVGTLLVVLGFVLILGVGKS